MNEEIIVCEIGDGTGVFEKDAYLDVPEGYSLIIEQEDRFLPPLDGRVVLNSDEIEGLIDDPFSNEIEARLFLIKNEDWFELEEDMTTIQLESGMEIDFDLAIDYTLFSMDNKMQLLALMLEYNEPDENGVYLTRQHLKESIMTGVSEYLKQTLQEQIFFNEETCEIDKSNPTFQEAYDDYLTNVEIHVEDFFEKIGILVNLDIIKFETYVLDDITFSFDDEDEDTWEA